MAVDAAGSVHPRYPKVFSAIRLGPVEIPNRIYFAPHGVNLALGTEPSFDFPYYSAERVRGGCGLVINSLQLTGKTLGRSSPYPEANIPSFRAMADAIHDEGGRIFGQLWYHPINAGNWFHLAPPRPLLAPSPRQQNGSFYSTRGMRRDELREFVDAHGRSASHLRAAGYDGVEVHISHGTLLEQFASPYFNRRTDEYGGSRKNRLRFVFECLEATREGAGSGLAVGIRFNCDELLAGGYDQAQAAGILADICGSGLIDFVDLDVAVEPNQFWLGMPPVFLDPQPYRPYVEAVRGAAGSVPVLSALGRLTSIAQAEEAIAAGVCDMAGAARELIAEPDLVRNAREGHEERSRTCIACNWCLDAAALGGAGCAINPASYRERLWGGRSFETAAATPSKVVVVGGGPGGLEAARVAALKGHQVVLYEARDELGGGLALWASLPGREWFQQAVDWWARELDRLGVEVRVATAATGQAVLGERPDAVIVATGSEYCDTGRSGFSDHEIPGHDQDFVYRPEDILLDGVRPQGKVVILDGEGIHTAVGIAELLAADGAQVELVTSSLTPVGPSLIGTWEVGFVVRRLNAAGVSISTQTWVRDIGDRSVSLYDVFTDEERTVDAVGAVVLCTSREARDPLADDLEGRVKQLFTVGDALGVRPMAAASFEGQMFARFIGEPDAPRTFAEAYWPAPDAQFQPKPASVLLTEQVGS